MSNSKEYNYMLLDRLKQDCEYYLGNGNRHAKHLWAGDEKKQIEKMLELYNSFTEEEKPEWISLEDIKNYAKQMNVSIIKQGNFYNSDLGKVFCLENNRNKEGIEYALLQKDNKYIIACGVNIDENSKLSWWNGIYRDNLLSATVVYEKMALLQRQKIENTIEAFKDIEPFILFSSVIEHEQDDSKVEIDDYDLKTLEIIYDEFISNDEMKLLSEEVKDLEENYNYHRIANDIREYLEDQGVDKIQISPDDIDEMVEDVIEESMNTGTDPSSLIWIDGYLDGKVDEYLENNEEEEDER